jgi:hypothetical protein
MGQELTFTRLQCANISQLPIEGPHLISVSQADPRGRAALSGTYALPAPIAWKPAECCAGANDMANSGEREVVARDHHLLTRASVEEASACLRSLIEIQVEPAAPIGVLEGDGAVPNNVCSTEKLVGTGRDLH